jgi:hypothetical protein
MVPREKNLSFVRDFLPIQSLYLQLLALSLFFLLIPARFGLIVSQVRYVPPRVCVVSANVWSNEGLRRYRIAAP